ncbi:DUF421 domain-containing protein [Tundrisphaera lichenicola]|uniref:DUF421 domain-containing protein n=1 Tax=Tundrisphaera lichenicola TaxID=2029860 RepID=UPI003EB9A779
MFENALSWADGILSPMFHLGPTVLEKMLRPILVYLFLVVLLRIFGKREMAQLNPFDLVVLLSLANTVQNSIIGEDNSVTGGLIGAFSLCAFNYLVIRFLFRHKRLDQWIEGRPSVLVREGKVQRRAMAREMITDAELRMMIHRQGFSSIDEVKSCTLEPGGAITLEGKSPAAVERHHSEILARLDDLTRQLEDLKQTLRPREPDAH